MSRVKAGDRVKIEFTGRLDDGTVIDSTRPQECDSEECGPECGCGPEECDDSECGCGGEAGPMELTIGAGDFFCQIEEALIGMAPGETKTVTIPAAEAFGEYDDEQVFVVERSDMPADLNPEVGAELVLTNDDDESMEVVVVATDEKTVTFDANHPLAGEDLIFDIELVEIIPA